MDTKQRPCLNMSDGSPSVVTSLACAFCGVLCGITALVWNKYPCCCFQHPCVLFGLQTTYHLKHSNLQQYDIISFAYFIHFSNLNISGTNADICKR